MNSFYNILNLTVGKLYDTVRPRCCTIKMYSNPSLDDECALTGILEVDEPFLLLETSTNNEQWLKILNSNGKSGWCYMFINGEERLKEISYET